MDKMIILYFAISIALVYAFLSKLDNEDSVNIWGKVIRSATIISALWAWTISATFSKDGLAFEMGDEYNQVGWGMAIITTVVQLAWNRMGKQKGTTIYLLGISAYTYSIYTNYLGIYAAQASGLGMATASGVAYLPIAWAIFLDLFPEPFLLWAWTNGKENSDPISQATAGANRPSSNSSNRKTDELNRKRFDAAKNNRKQRPLG